MNQKLFKNSDIQSILNMPMRRIVNFTDKGLVVPVVDASGAGSKREYSYINLLQFGLIEYLFDIGMQIQMVKKIITHLREDGDFERWATNFDDYFLRAAEKYVAWAKDQERKNVMFSSHLLYDPDKTRDPNIIKNNLKPKKTTGFLFYTFKKDGNNKKRIVPYEIVVPWDDRNFIAVPFLFEDIVAGSVLTVNLGSIKEEIDKNINKKP
jgi:DNA-binding transcriptional MerR regulator